MMKRMLTSLLCVLVLTISSLKAQNRQVKGKVSDDTGVPLSGASITVKGTEIRTATNSDGVFSLTVPASLQNIEIVVSYLNYADKIMPVTGNDVNVMLTKTSRQIDEVIVVGYGTQKKRNVTGAVATFNAENLDERPIIRLDQGLIGQMAGVQVKQTTGAPGKPFSINIRGTGSFSASNEPLYVIDGFPVATEGVNGSGNFDNGSPLDNLNPNDIESIQVLKDAAAAAIYGSRAANGVVLITTKKGKTGKNQITLNVYGGLSKAAKRLDLLDGDQWIARAKEFINSAWVASGTGRTAAQTTQERRTILGLAPGTYNVGLMSDERWDIPGHPGLDYVDWQDIAFRTANVQNYQLSASGGNENARYYISGNYQNQKGYVIGMGYKTYTGRANVEVNLTKKMKFGLNISPSFSIKDDPGVEGKDNTLHKMMAMAPVQESAPDANGRKYTVRYAWAGTDVDPLTRLEQRVGQAKMSRVLAGSYFDLEIAKGLNARSTFNFDNVDNINKGYVPSATLASISGSYGSYRKQNFVNENTVSYARQIGSHNISAVAGNSYNTYKIDKVTLASNGNFAYYDVTTLPANSVGSTNEERSVLISYFGRVQYDYDGKYLLSASVRRDGSSRFGSEYRWGNFPSVSAGWRISQEKFFHVKQINDLKLRASYGASGNNNIGNYSWLSTLAAFNYSFGGTQNLGTGLNRITNKLLHWERSYSNNYGLDVSAFNNRITMSFDYYNKRNKDMLLNTPIPVTSGFNTILTNLGEVLNKGWELEINTRNLRGGAMQWNTSLNLSHNSNKLVKLDGVQQRIEVAPNFGEVPYALMEVGLPMYSIYVVQQNGVLTADDIAKGYPMLGTQKVGDPRYVDAVPDGKITAADRVVVGQPNPKYTWGITNTVKYKGFDLSVFVQGQNGGSVYSLFGRAMNLTGMSGTQNTLDIDPAIRGNYKTSFGSIVNTDWLYSSDYVSIRSIIIGYDLTKLMKNNKAFFKGARIYLTGENWFYWDNYKGGFNPEATNANLSGNSNIPVPGDYGGLPQSRSVTMGLNLSF